MTDDFMPESMEWGVCVCVGVDVMPSLECGGCGWAVV